MTPFHSADLESVQVKRLLLAVCLATVLLDAGVSGRWTADENRGGNTLTVTMNLEMDADGATVTGTVTGAHGEADITDGRVDGDEISFSVIRDYDGRQITQRYEGTVEGDLIHFRLTVEGGQFGGGSVNEFDARRIS